MTINSKFEIKSVLFFHRNSTTHPISVYFVPMDRAFAGRPRRGGREVRREGWSARTAQKDMDSMVISGTNRWRYGIVPYVGPYILWVYSLRNLGLKFRPFFLRNRYLQSIGSWRSPIDGYPALGISYGTFLWGPRNRKGDDNSNDYGWWCLQLYS